MAFLLQDETRFPKIAPSSSLYVCHSVCLVLSYSPTMRAAVYLLYTVLLALASIYAAAHGTDNGNRLEPRQLQVFITSASGSVFTVSTMLGPDIIPSTSHGGSQIGAPNSATSTRLSTPAPAPTRTSSTRTASISSISSISSTSSSKTSSQTSSSVLSRVLSSSSTAYSPTSSSPSHTSMSVPPTSPTLPLPPATTTRGFSSSTPAGGSPQSNAGALSNGLPTSTKIAMGVAIPLGSLLVAAVIYLLVKSRKRDNRRNTVVYDTENLQAIQEIGGAGEAPAAKPPNADRHTFNARASQVQRQSIGDMIDHTEDDPELAPPSYNELPESQLSRRR